MTQPFEYCMRIKSELRNCFNFRAGALRECLLGQQRVPQQAWPDRAMALGVARDGDGGHAAVDGRTGREQFERA